MVWIKSSGVLLALVFAIAIFLALIVLTFRYFTIAFCVFIIAALLVTIRFEIFGHL